MIAAGTRLGVYEVLAPLGAGGMGVLLNTGGERNDHWMVEGFPRPAGSWRRWFGFWELPARTAGQ